MRAHSHPGSDWNDLNAREAPEECRCAYIPRVSARSRWFIRPGVCREIRLRRRRILDGEISRASAPVARHASIFINVTGNHVILTDWPYVLSVPTLLLAQSRWLSGIRDSGEAAYTPTALAISNVKNIYRYIFKYIVNPLQCQIEHRYWAISTDIVLFSEMVNWFWLIE